VADTPIRNIKLLANSYHSSSKSLMVTGKEKRNLNPYENSIQLVRHDWPMESNVLRSHARAIKKKCNQCLYKYRSTKHYQSRIYQMARIYIEWEKITHTLMVAMGGQKKRRKLTKRKIVLIKEKINWKIISSTDNLMPIKTNRRATKIIFNWSYSKNRKRKVGPWENSSLISICQTWSCCTLWKSNCQWKEVKWINKKELY